MGRPIRWIGILALAVCARAQTPAPFPADPAIPGERPDSLSAAPLPSVAGDSSAAFPDSSAAESLAVKPSAQAIAAFRFSVLRSVTALGKKQYGKAARLLAPLRPGEDLASIYQALLLYRAYAGMEDWGRADSVLEDCRNRIPASAPVWRDHLLNQRVKAFARALPSDSLRLAFYARVVEEPAGKAVKVNFLYELLRARGFAGSPEGFEDLLAKLISLASADRRLDSLYQLLAPRAAPGTVSRGLQNLMLDLEGKLGLYAQARRRVESLLDSAAGPAEKRSLLLNRAGLYFKDKDYREAVSAYENYLQEYGDHPDAYMQTARAYDRLQEPAKAVAWYDAFLEKFPKHDKTSEIYWLRAWDLEAEGNFGEAVEYYFRQAGSGGGSKRWEWSSFRVGLCYYKSGSLAAALQGFRATPPGSPAYPASLLWGAKVLEEMGDSLGARAGFQELARTYPFHFYGHTGRRFLVARGVSADSLDPVARLPSSRPESVKVWMKTVLSGFDDSLYRNYESAYLPVGELLRLRLDTLATLTVQAMPPAAKNNPWLLYTYSRMFRDRGLWKESYQLGLQLGQKIPSAKWNGAPLQVLRLFFPRPYQEVVGKYALKRRIDPAFVFALMRQESGFDAGIKSSAGAVGLMQLMPATAKSLAKKLGWERFDPYALISPEINVNLGTLYLRDLEKEYAGSDYFVLANYNAGPEPTRRWLSLHGSRPPEAMVEEISYWETRDYVKKVMGNYWTYKLLWK